MAINLRNNVTGTGLNLVTNPILKSSATNPVNIGVKTPVNQYKSEDPRYANKTQVNTQVQTTAPMSVNPKYQTTTPVQTQTQVQTPVNNNQSRFIGFQAPTLQDSLNILQQRQQTQGNTTKKTTTAKTTKNNNYTYDQLVKAIQDFHYDVKNSDGKLTKEQISKKYPEFKGKEEEALRLQEALLPYVKDNEFAPIEGIQQYFPDLLQIQQQGQEKATGIEGLKQFGAGLKERFEAFGRGVDNLLSKGQSQLDGSGVDLNAYTKYIQEKYGVSYPAKLDKATRDKELEAVKNDPSLLAPYTTKTADDILDVAEGGVDIAFSTFNPVATAAFTTAGGLESMMGGGALTWFGEKMGGIGSIINELPGLKQLRDSLSEENQQRFDMFVANSALGLIMGTKNKQNIIKNPKQFLIENLQPNQISKNFMENVIGISDKAYSGVQRAGKFVKKIGEEKNIVTNGVKNADNVNLKGENIVKNADNTEIKAGEVKQGENKITETNNVTKNGGWSKGKVNESIISKGVDAISEGLGKIKKNIVEPITDAAATKITSTATPQDKLFQAVSPSLNRLTNKRGNYNAKRQNADRSNELIIEYGYQPKNTTEYYADLIKTKQDLWKEIQAGLDEHAKTTVNSKELTDYVREAMSDDAKYPLETNKADLARLTRELDSLDEIGELSLERLEAIKQQINAKLNYGKNAEAGEIYEKGLREMNKKISEMEDQMVAELPGELTKFKKDYGALKDMEEDVLKMMLKDMKRKSGGSLYQNRGRLEALGKITTAPLEATLQFMLGESLGKARDVDFLIEKGFKDLKDMYKGEKKTLQVKKAVTAKKDNVTAKKEEPKKEDMSKKEEKTNMKKEPEQKKEDSARKEEKSEKKEDSMSDFVKEMEESSNIKEGEVSYKDISTRTLNKLYESEKTPKSEKAKIEKELESREADMNGGAKDYDLLDHEYAYRINQLAEEEKRIGKVGKNDVNKEYKEKQSLELKKKVDRLREEMKEDYKDRFSSDAELDDHYNALRNKGINYINEYKLSKNYSTFKQEDELINSLNERWSKQPKFVRELTEEQQNVRESSIGDYKNDNYEIKTTDYQDSFSSKNNPKNKGAIYWGDNERVVVNRIETLKESGLLEKLPDDMKVEVSGEGEIGTIKDLKNLDSEGVLGGEPKTPRNVIGNGKNNATTRFQKGKSLEKDNKNGYNTTTKSSSLTSPGNIRASGGSNTPIATTFSKGLRKIIINGKEYTHTPGKYSFVTNHVFKQTGKNAEYVKNFNEALSKGDKFAVVGNDGGHDIKLYFNKNFGDHFVKHGGFPIENLVETLNKFDSKDINNGKFIYQKQLPNGKRLRAIVSKNYSEISFFESKTQWKPNAVTGKKTNATDGGLRMQKGSDNKLIALHNLNMENLAKNKKLGGFAMPSIAVTKQGVPHTSYGDISIIFKGDTIDPKANKANKLYGTDAYTPTFPSIKAIPKDSVEASKIVDKIEKETGLSYGEIHQWMEFREEYEREYPQLKKYSDDYDKLVDYKIFDGYTNTGKRRYLDYNLENVVKYMKKQDGKTAFGNFGKLVGDEKGKLKGIEDARNAEYALTDKEAYRKLAGDYSDAMWDVFNKITDEDSFLDFDIFSSDIEDAFNKNDAKWLEKAKYYLGDYGENITLEDIQKIHKPIKEGAAMKRPYAEAKPERPVGFDEVGAIVVPEEQLTQAKELLKDTGVEVYGYKEGERMKVIDEVADKNDLRFQKAGKTTSKEFKEWFGDWENDPKNASKVVDENGKPLEVYHGSYEGGFNIFDKKLRGSATNAKSAKLGFFFTDNESLAKEYSKRSADGQLYKVYLDMKNPLIRDFKGENVNADKELTNLIKEAKSIGNDGVIAKNLKDGFRTDNQYVVFESNQIKSATDNIGTFDKNNPDIRFQQGENIGRSSFTEKSLNKAIENMKKTGLAKDVKTVDTVSDLRKELKGKISKSDLLQVDGEIAGCTTPDGTVYLVKEFLRDDTLKHEFAHRFRSYAEKNNPELFKAINKVAEEAPTELKERIKRDYGELSDDALLDEVFAWKQGEFKVTGAELKWYQKMWKAIEEVWNSIKSKFGKNYADLSAFDGWEKMSSEQIMSKINDILENGKKVGKPKNLVTNKRLREQAVWHGSPADFDKFDSTHMGEGEGAQAHGWGHYVAVDEKTGRHYAEMGGKKLGLGEYKGKSYDKLRDINLEKERGRGEMTDDELAGFRVLRHIDNNGFTVEEAIKDLTDKQARFIEDVKGYIKKGGDEYLTAEEWEQELPKIEKDYKALKGLKAEDFKLSKRNLYNLDIPDPIKKDTPTGSNYLEENPHNSDPNFMKAFITDEQQLEFSKLLSRENKEAGRKFSNRISRLYGNKNMVGGDLYKELSSALGSDKAASQFLNKIGYDGIHYFGGRDGEAYVIFNDDALKINSHTRYQKNGVTANGKNAVTSKTRFMKSGSENSISQKWINKGVKNTGKGDFGNIYEGVKGKDAISFMLEARNGEVRGAYQHNGEPIDIIRGKTNAETNGKGYGLSKIEEKHSDVIERLDNLMTNTKGVEDDNGVLIYDNGKDRAIILPHWNNNKKRWLLTAYKLHDEFKRK